MSCAKSSHKLLAVRPTRLPQEEKKPQVPEQADPLSGQWISKPSQDIPSDLFETGKKLFVYRLPGFVSAFLNGRNRISAKINDE